MPPCVWLNPRVFNDKFRIYVIKGEPGVGKTTAALHIVAVDLVRRGIVSDYQQALTEAAKRMYLGRSLEDTLEYLREVAAGGRPRDWLIVDDAALGFFDVGSAKAFAAIMDAIKVARESLATRGIIITTTSKRYVSRRLLESGVELLVVRALTRFRPTFRRGKCTLVQEKEPHGPYILLMQFKIVPVMPITPELSNAKIRPKARVAAIIPIDEEFRMPEDVEAAHLAARKERVLASLEEALRQLEKMKEDRRLAELEAARDAVAEIVEDAKLGEFDSGWVYRGPCMKTSYRWLRAEIRRRTGVNIRQRGLSKLLTEMFGEHVELDGTYITLC